MSCFSSSSWLCHLKYFGGSEHIPHYVHIICFSLCIHVLIIFESVTISVEKSVARCNGII